MDRVAREDRVAHRVGVARSADLDGAVLQLVEVAAGLDVAPQESRELAVVRFDDGEPFVWTGRLEPRGLDTGRRRRANRVTHRGHDVRRKPAVALRAVGTAPVGGGPDATRARGEPALSVHGYTRGLGHRLTRESSLAHRCATRRTSRQGGAGSCIVRSGSRSR